MHMKKIYIIIIIALLLIIVGAFYVAKDKDKSESFEHPFLVLSSDVINSWEFDGIYKNNKELEEGVYNKIKELENMFDSEEFSDYELYLSLAGQYDLLGKGDKVYEYLGRSLVIDSEHTGVAWQNMGGLMEHLGAYNSAKVAFNRAVEAQPIPVYYLSLIDFLERHFPEDTTSIEDAKAAIGLSSSSDE